MSIDENELDEMVDAFTEALYALTGRRFDDRGNRMSPKPLTRRPFA